MEKAYEKHAWIIFFVFGIVELIGGLMQIISPKTFGGQLDLTWAEIVAISPEIENFVSFWIRIVGHLNFSIGISVMAIAYGPYKQGEKWAWYAIALLVTSFSVLSIGIYQTHGQSNLYNIVLVIIYGLGLGLPYRKFFPERFSKTS